MILRLFTVVLAWAVILTFAAIFLTGCSTVEGQAYTAVVREAGKAEAAAVLEGVDWYRCRGSPVGAIVDRYGVSTQKWTAYLLSCMGFWSEQPMIPPKALLPVPPIPPAGFSPFVEPGV